jgi:hypothetical protein
VARKRRKDSPMCTTMLRKKNMMMALVDSTVTRIGFGIMVVTSHKVVR